MCISDKGLALRPSRAYPGLLPSTEPETVGSVRPRRDKKAVQYSLSHIHLPLITGKPCQTNIQDEVAPGGPM
jgi:hypothetical protein